MQRHSIIKTFTLATISCASLFADRYQSQSFIQTVGDSTSSTKEFMSLPPKIADTSSQVKHLVDQHNQTKDMDLAVTDFKKTQHPVLSGQANNALRILSNNISTDHTRSQSSLKRIEGLITRLYNEIDKTNKNRSETLRDREGLFQTAYNKINESQNSSRMSKVSKKKSAPQVTPKATPKTSKEKLAEKKRQAQIQKDIQGTNVYNVKASQSTKRTKKIVTPKEKTNRSEKMSRAQKEQQEKKQARKDKLAEKKANKKRQAQIQKDIQATSIPETDAYSFAG